MVKMTNIVGDYFDKFYINLIRKLGINYNIIEKVKFRLVVDVYEVSFGKIIETVDFCVTYYLSVIVIVT